MGISQEREEKLSKVLDKSVEPYLEALRNSLGDLRLLEQLLVKAERERLLANEPQESKELIIEALRRNLETQGYSIYKMCLTFIWAEAEAFMNDFIKSWLLFVDKPFTLEIFTSIKINETVATFEGMSQDEVAFLYTKLLKEKVGGGRNSAVKTFYKVLKHFELNPINGDGQKELEKNLTELQHVRNVLVHRGGIVDKHLLSMCPWLEGEPDVELGKRFPLHSGRATIYGLSTTGLVLDVLERVRALLHSP